MSFLALTAVALANPTPEAPRLDAPRTCTASKTWSTIGMIGTGVVTTGVVAPLLIAPNSEAGALVPIASVAVGAPMIVAGGIGSLAGARRCAVPGAAVTAGVGYLAAGVGAPLTVIGLVGAVGLAFSDSSLAVPLLIGGISAGAVGVAGLGLALGATGRMWAVPGSAGKPGLTVTGRF